MEQFNDPIRAGEAPIQTPLETDKTYSWCTCGHSEKQPLCDGSHRDAGCAPSLKFKVDESKNYFLCSCKQTKNPPFCDGNHAAK